MFSAEGNKLFNNGKRVGQLIVSLPTQSSEVELFKLEGDDYNYIDLIRRTVIDKKEFYKLLEKGDYARFLNFPLYSLKYFKHEVFLQALKDKEPIDFDFIQVQGRLLMWAENGEVKKIGEIDKTVAYHLLNLGIDLGKEGTISGVQYSVEKSVPLPKRLSNDVILIYRILEQLYGDVEIVDITESLVVTSKGTFYRKGNVVSRDQALLDRVDTENIEYGFVEEFNGEVVLKCFKLRSGCVVDVKVGDKVKLYLGNVVLSGDFSIHNGKVRGLEESDVVFNFSYESYSIEDFVEVNDKIYAVVKYDDNVYVYEDVELVKKFDKLTVNYTASKVKPEDIERVSDFLKSFMGNGVRVYFGEKTLLVFGSGDVHLKHVVSKDGTKIVVFNGVKPKLLEFVDLNRIAEIITKGYANVRSSVHLERKFRLWEFGKIFDLYATLLTIPEIKFDVTVYNDYVVVRFLNREYKFAISEDCVFKRYKNLVLLSDEMVDDSLIEATFPFVTSRNARLLVVYRNGEYVVVGKKFDPEEIDESRVVRVYSNEIFHRRDVFEYNNTVIRILWWVVVGDTLYVRTFDDTFFSIRVNRNMSILRYVEK